MHQTTVKQCWLKSYQLPCCPQGSQSLYQSLILSLYFIPSLFILVPYVFFSILPSISSFISFISLSSLSFYINSFFSRIFLHFLFRCPFTFHFQTSDLFSSISLPLFIVYFPTVTLSFINSLGFYFYSILPCIISILMSFFSLSPFFSVFFSLSYLVCLFLTFSFVFLVPAFVLNQAS